MKMKQNKALVDFDVSNPGPEVMCRIMEKKLRVSQGPPRIYLSPLRVKGQGTRVGGSRVLIPSELTFSLIFLLT